MKLLLICLFLLLNNINAKDLKITKYITNEKPKILFEYVHSNNNINHLLKIDSELISNYRLSVGKHIKNLTEINYDNYSNNINYLLRIDFQNNSLIALLYNLVSHQILLYKKYSVSNFNTYPFIIHSLSYDINSRLGFKNVPWIKRKIVYSVNIAPKENAIFISDITLTYRKKIISGGFNIFPKWADKNQTEIYYTKYIDKPTLFKYNIYTGKKEKILTSEGMLIVSDVKDNKLLLTLAPNDQSDIYEYDLNSKELTRLTQYKGIDVSGKFYNDNSILFISDRLGNPNVYQKNLFTNVVKKIIYYSKNQVSLAVYKNDIVISTRETDNAFDKNTFNLFLIKNDTENIKRLTFTGKNILPIFSNDGSTVLFIKEHKFNSKLGIIRLNKNKIFYFRLSKIIQSFDF
jgi:TolB protein